MRRAFVLLGPGGLAPAVALAQSAGEVERCFQNPAALRPAAVAAAAPAPSGGGARRGDAAGRTGAGLCDGAAEPRTRPQAHPESLRTLDKYNGPIDGNLQSEATAKAISDWQKGTRPQSPSAS